MGKLIPSNSRIYQTDALARNIYPEQFDTLWQESNPSRADPLEVPEDWPVWDDPRDPTHANRPAWDKPFFPVKSERTNLPLHQKPLSKEDVDRIIANATSREDFHDYNWQQSADAGYGSCLCEVRIISGSDCVKHLEKGELGDLAKVGEPCNNKHWAWQIDIAPRDKICPRALMRYDDDVRAASGAEHLVKATGCREILLVKAIPEEWVLATMPKDSGFAIPGRAITDIMRPNSKCFSCRYKDWVNEFNEVIVDQVYKLDPRGMLEWPMRYDAENGKTRHKSLVPGEYYGAKRLADFGVREEEWYNLQNDSIHLDLLNEEQRELAARELGVEDPFAVP
jgi:hypothetical protein